VEKEASDYFGEEMHIRRLDIWSTPDVEQFNINQLRLARNLSQAWDKFRPHRMHEMRTIATDVPVA